MGLERPQLNGRTKVTLPLPEVLENEGQFRHLHEPRVLVGFPLRAMSR